MNNLQITRIDLFDLQPVYVCKYNEIFAGRFAQVKTEQKEPGFDLAGALQWLKGHGWEINNWLMGWQAWKTEHPSITRLDFTQTPEKLLVQEYQDCSEPGPAQNYKIMTNIDLPAPFDLQAGLAWLEAHGWHVRRWLGGARAFSGKPQPIRTAGQIKRLRSQLQQYPIAGLETHCLDLAYDY